MYEHRNRRDLLGTGLTLAASLGLAGLPASAAGGRPDDRRRVVKTAEGRLAGRRTDHGDVWKGIRYGEDTTTRRFEPPVRVTAWQGIRDATSFGDPCHQRSDDTLAFADHGRQSEDCLFLNVWAPRDADRRPVMVWLHGGGYWYGSAGCAAYDGEALAERGDVVVVGINHRLNLFGYLYLGGLSADFAGTANPGHLDIVEALRWVRRNIAAFGGDPDNVTVFGESGGACKVSALLAMPAAKGLVHRGIVMSGSQLKVRTEEQATEEALKVLRAVGLRPEEAGRLRTIAPDRLLHAYDATLTDFKFPRLADVPFSPVLHAGSLPYQPDDERALVLSRDVPLLVGITDEEAAYSLSLEGAIGMPSDDQAVVTRLTSFFDYVDELKAKALVAAYRATAPGIDRQRLLIAISTGVWMGGSAIRQAELKSNGGGAPAYAYRFGWKDPFLGDRWAVHGADLAFVFDKIALGDFLEKGVDTPALRAKMGLTADAALLRDAVMSAWTRFAETGSPENPLMPAWPGYSRQRRATMRLDSRCRLVVDPDGPAVRELLVAMS